MLKTRPGFSVIGAWLLGTSQLVSAQTGTLPVTAQIGADKAGPTISRDIFGQFAEMLGAGIYGGIWVGKDSKIPNVRGVRSDVVAALKALKVPVVRWPGGCFADEYDWRNGVGAADKRRATINYTWGGVIEPNSFGTDEFMDFAGQIGSEAFVSVNVGSATSKDAAEWVEYMTADKPSALGAQRMANGHKQPYRIKYLGLGNESWGCGGAMTADAYVERLKLFSHFVHNYNPAQAGASSTDILISVGEGKFTPAMLEMPTQGMRRIAVGPDGANTAYTETVMKAWAERGPASIYWGFEGLSMHFYTTGGGSPMSYASTGFDEKQYATLLKETLGMDPLISKHSAIMDKYDPQKKVALVVDEWGAWLKPMPGTETIFLKQQGSLRDGILAALNLNIFARHADRVRMTNIAQMVNVIQSMILTDGAKMVLTPNYHVYKMYVPFQDAKLIPVTFDPGSYVTGAITLPKVDMIAARGLDGQVWLALVNLDPSKSASVITKVAGMTAAAATGEVLTAERVDSVNEFDVKPAVTPVPYGATARDGKLTLELPPKSVMVVKLQ